MASGTPTFRWCEAELHRLRGEFILSDRTGLFSEGEACIKLALDTAHGQSCRAYELRAAISLVRCLTKDGRKDQACQVLSNVYDSFTEGFDLPDLRLAKELLDLLK